jgi:hypothetical protein
LTRFGRVRVEVYEQVIRPGLVEIAVPRVTRTTARVMSRAMVKAPVDHGNLRNSHHMAVVVEAWLIRGRVWNTAEYAAPVHEGRRAVTIRPVRRKALAFTWMGQHMVRHTVHQPARRGRPWLREALRDVATADGYRMTRGGKYGPPATG